MTDTSTDIVVNGSPAARAPNELTIIVNGNEVAGWEDIELTLRAEGFPNSFSVRMSTKDPKTDAPVVAKAGDACTVLLGNDVVITGYIDRDSSGGSATSHILGLIGRGKTQDLVDCSGEWPKGQLTQVDALKIAQTLALPYSIAVALGDGASAGDNVPQWNLNYGESAAAIIQRVARNAGLLAYEDSTGKLILATAGTKKAASGIAYGQNVQEWQAENSMDGRYSAIVCCSQSMDVYQDLAGSDFFDTESDPNVPRHRQMYMVLEAVADHPQDFTIKKAKWEVSRRAGRSAVVTATVDSWRDSAGKLWAPNTLVPVNVPGNRAGNSLVLSQVVFRKSNEKGTTADMLLMPATAFTPEPITLQPVSTADLNTAPAQ